MQGLILEILYSCGFMTVGLLVNRIGKFPVLGEFQFFQNVYNKFVSFN